MWSWSWSWRGARLWRSTMLASSLSCGAPRLPRASCPRRAGCWPPRWTTARRCSASPGWRSARSPTGARSTCSTNTGEIERVAVHHSDPGSLALAERLNRDYRPALEEPTGVPEVIRTGRLAIHTDIPPDALAEYARDNQHLELLSAIGATAVIIVPMIGADRTDRCDHARLRGVQAPLSRRGPRRSPSDSRDGPEPLSKTLGCTPSAARIAHTLQRALLPESLPELPGRRGEGALLRGGRAQRGRRRLLRRVPIRRRRLDASDRRRLRQGAARRRRSQHWPATRCAPRR